MAAVTLNRLAICGQRLNFQLRVNAKEWQPLIVWQFWNIVTRRSSRSGHQENGHTFWNVDHTVCPFYRHPAISCHESLSNRKSGNVALVPHPHPPLCESGGRILPVLKTSYAIQWATVIWGYGVDSSGFSWRPVAGCCGHDGESVGSTKCGEFLTLCEVILASEGLVSLRPVSW
jgi:hypothetical protein